MQICDMTIFRPFNTITNGFVAPPSVLQSCLICCRLAVRYGTRNGRAEGDRLWGGGNLQSLRPPLGAWYTLRATVLPTCTQLPMPVPIVFRLLPQQATYMVNRSCWYGSGILDDVDSFRAAAAGRMEQCAVVVSS